MEQIYYWESDDRFSNKEMFLLMVYEMQCLVYISLPHSIVVTKFQRIGTVTMKGYCYNAMLFHSSIEWSLSVNMLLQLTQKHQVSNVGIAVTGSVLLHRLIALYSTVVTIRVIKNLKILSLSSTVNLSVRYDSHNKQRLLLCSYRAYWIINVYYTPTYAHISGVNIY